MPRQTLLSKLNTQKGATLASLVKELNGAQAQGKPLKLTLHPYATPYLDHTLDGFTDGPPTSTVAAVLSAAAPGGHAWRRMTLSRVGPWHYELEVFPTEFGDPKAPLAPGIPPGPTRQLHH